MTSDLRTCPLSYRRKFWITGSSGNIYANLVSTAKHLVCSPSAVDKRPSVSASTPSTSMFVTITIFSIFSTSSQSTSVNFCSTVFSFKTMEEGLHSRVPLAHNDDSAAQGTILSLSTFTYHVCLPQHAMCQPKTCLSPSPRPPT